MTTCRMTYTEAQAKLAEIERVMDRMKRMLQAREDRAAFDSPVAEISSKLDTLIYDFVTVDH